MLFIVATPIGNLGDITVRAMQVLKDADYILAENSAHSRKLLQHLGISKRLISFHDHNESGKCDSVIEDLLSGKNIALISDAGTPLLSDPGFTLIRACIDNKIAYTAVPGPSSVITALSLSGLAPIPFQFIGFLPKKKNQLIQSINNIRQYSGTTVAFETPHRMLETLEVFSEIIPHAKIVLARELTKQFEEVIRGTASEIIQRQGVTPWRGEYVIMIDHSVEAHIPSLDEIQKYVYMLIDTEGFSEKDAIQKAASLFSIQKRTLYQHIMRGKEA